MGKRFGLFEVFGVEVEYMLVDRETLDVRPAADRFLLDADGEPSQSLEWGSVGWSNELVLHLLELKNPEPAPSLSELETIFFEAVCRANRELQDKGLRLMPGAMHPWMDPTRETQIWPHGDQEIYAAYDRIFDCKAHGWANLQSVHLNLPFNGDEEFARLHSAIRLVLPIIPALCASSPFLEGRVSGFIDQRMEVYRTNSRLVEGITGKVIPELVLSEAQYREEILEPMYEQIAPHDPDHVLRDEWLNARGAIARFDRDAIEIRVIDSQECTSADIAVLQLIVAALRGLTDQVWSSGKTQRSLTTELLAKLLADVVKDGERTRITDVGFLGAFGIQDESLTAAELWRHIFDVCAPVLPDPQRACLELIFNQGPLARRLLSRVGERPSKSALLDVARLLCASLGTNSPLRGF